MISSKTCSTRVCSRPTWLAKQIARYPLPSTSDMRRKCVGVTANPVGSSTLVAWDLDNMGLPKSASKRVSIPSSKSFRNHSLSDMCVIVMVSRLKRIATQAAVTSPSQRISLRAYANPSTIERLEDTIPILTACDVTLVEAKSHKQSADWLITSDITSFAREAGSQGHLVLVSTDNGFVDGLRYASGLGCSTTVVGDFESSWKKSQGVRDMRNNKLAGVADSALVWSKQREIAVEQDEIQSITSVLQNSEDCCTTYQNEKYIEGVEELCTIKGGVVGGRFDTQNLAQNFGYPKAQKVQLLENGECFLAYDEKIRRKKK